jgi:hypothetical protein
MLTTAWGGFTRPAKSDAQVIYVDRGGSSSASGDAFDHR